MEAASISAINDKSREMEEIEQLADWVKAIDKHVSHGSPAYFYLKDEKALLDFMKLVGHETVKSDQVIAYYYGASANERLEITREELIFDGELTIVTILNWIADSGINLEFPNDFQVNIAVALDEETMVLYEYGSSAEPVVCEECQNSTNPDVIE